MWLYSGCASLHTLVDDGTGDWVKCDDAWIGVESYRDYRFLDTPNFNIESAKTGTLAVRLNIKIPGDVLCIYVCTVSLQCSI